MITIRTEQLSSQLLCYLKNYTKIVLSDYKNTLYSVYKYGTIKEIAITSELI